MSGAPTVPSRAVRRTTAPVLTPGALFSWHGRFASLDALTGQVGTLTRASTATSIDTTQSVWYVPYGYPRWYVYPSWNLSADPVVNGMFAQSGEDVTWPMDFVPQSMTILIEGINSGATPVSGGGVLHLGNDAATGNALSIVGTATTYQLTLTTGAGSVSSTLSSAVGNNRIRLVAQMEDNGTTQRVRFGISINESAFAFGSWTSTLTRAATFPSSSKVRLNRIGSAGTYGDTWFRRVSIYPGLLTLDEASARL
jgi:hypothetical protein